MSPGRLCTSMAVWRCCLDTRLASVESRKTEAVFEGPERIVERRSLTIWSAASRDCRMNLVSVAAAVLVLASSLAMPSPALAQSEDLLECVVGAVSVTLREDFGRALLSPGQDSEMLRTYEKLTAISDECSARFALSPTQSAAYLEYGVARISRDWLITEMAKLGLSDYVVNQALGFGPGRANLDFSQGLAKNQVALLARSFSEAGVDIENVPSGGWELVGSYIAATSKYWRSLKRFAELGSTDPSVGPRLQIAAATIEPVADSRTDSLIAPQDGLPKLPYDAMMWGSIADNGISKVDRRIDRLSASLPYVVAESAALHLDYDAMIWGSLADNGISGGDRRTDTLSASLPYVVAESTAPYLDYDLWAILLDIPSLGG